MVSPLKNHRGAKNLKKVKEIMKRRSFLKGAAVAVAATTIPFTLGRAEDKNRIVEIDTEDGWTRIEMSYLKPGDVFRIRENGKTLPTMKAEGSPHIVHDDIWGIQIVEEEDKVPKREVRKYTSTSTLDPWQVKERKFLKRFEKEKHNE